MMPTDYLLMVRGQTVTVGKAGQYVYKGTLDDCLDFIRLDVKNQTDPENL